ncbi:MAG: hypothetical protein ACK4FP_00215 [Azonexus sp.]
MAVGKLSNGAARAGRHAPSAAGDRHLRHGCHRLSGGERLSAWLSGHAVEAVLCGHVHRFVMTRLAGTPVITCPATVHQIALQDGALAWTSEPAAMLVHDLLPGAPMRTHLLPLRATPVHPYD